MARFSFLLSAFFVVSVATFVQSAATKMEEERAVQLNNGINQFSAQFYKEVARTKPSENLIMSPLSAEIALAMLSLGAQGETLEEINTALRLPNQEFTKAAFKPAIAKINAIKGVTLNIANKVFVMTGEQFELDNEFKRSSSDVFASEAENLNFGENVKAAKTINTWVEEKTKDKIKNLVEADSLNSDTRLVLINAIYFKGSWEKKFDKESTHKADFHLNNKEKVQVDMMSQTAKFNYAEIPEWNAKIVELPYAEREMSMVIILPNDIEGLAALEEKLAGGDLTQMLDRMDSVEVALMVPKFKIETTMDLNEVLPKLGMKRMFDQNRAQLKGLLKNDEQLFVSKAVQKAFIEVNEEGAEAAAATGMMMMCRMLPMTMSFAADRPFFYVIRESSKVIFTGKVIRPELD